MTMTEPFCKFVGLDWLDWFEQDFYEVVDVFDATGTSWAILQFANNPNAGLLILSHGERYISGFRLTKYAEYFKDAKGCLYGAGGRYTGGSAYGGKIGSEREDFIINLRRALGDI
jgi:hypothetical protein